MGNTKEALLGDLTGEMYMSNCTFHLVYLAGFLGSL